MQYFEQLAKQASELTVYDVKSAVTKVSSCAHRLDRPLSSLADLAHLATGAQRRHELHRVRGQSQGRHERRDLVSVPAAQTRLAG